MAPTPGTTVNVNVPVPGEQQVTDTSIQYGWLIAIGIIAALVYKLFGHLLKSPQVRLICTATLAGAAAYWLTKIGVF